MTVPRVSGHADTIRKALVAIPAPSALAALDALEAQNQTLLYVSETAKAAFAAGLFSADPVLGVALEKLLDALGRLEQL